MQYIGRGLRWHQGAVSVYTGGGTAAPRITPLFSLVSCRSVGNRFSDIVNYIETFPQETSLVFYLELHLMGLFQQGGGPDFCHYGCVRACPLDV